MHHCFRVRARGSDRVRVSEPESPGGRSSQWPSGGLGGAAAAARPPRQQLKGSVAALATLHCSGKPEPGKRSAQCLPVSGSRHGSRVTATLELLP